MQVLLPTKTLYICPESQPQAWIRAETSTGTHLGAVKQLPQVALNSATDGVERQVVELQRRQTAQGLKSVRQDAFETAVAGSGAKEVEGQPRGQRATRPRL